MKYRSLMVMATLAAFAAGCNRDLSPLNTTTTVFAPTPTPIVGCPPPFDPTMICDFETDINLWPATDSTWGGGPTAQTISWSQDISHSCYSSVKIVEGKYVGYGHWFGMTWGGGEKSFPQATSHNLSFWYMIDSPVTTTLSVDEGSSNGGDGEAWSATVTFLPSATMQHMVIPLASFTSGGGNGVFDTQDIVQIWYYHQATYLAHTLYFDDFQFTP